MKYEVRKIKVGEYQHLRRAVGWWDTDESEIKEALDNSLYSVTAMSD